MKNISISCIGSGNMGYALMQGIISIMGKDGSEKTDICFADSEIEKAKTSAEALGINFTNSNIEAAEKGDFIFLAVKPQVLNKVLSEIAPVIKKRITTGNAPVLVSMAAGWSIEKIQSVIAAQMPTAHVPVANVPTAHVPIANVPVARIMPNTPALVSKGMITLAVSPEVSSENKTALIEMLQGAGIVDLIDEKYFNAVTGLSGSGPAFVCLFIEALSDGGVLAGLPRDKALLYAAQTVLGTASMVLETGKHPGELKDMVTSPGGTTISGIAALEAGGFRSVIIEAVQAAWQRAEELSN